MNIHKLLIGEGAESYLPFALSKVRFLAATRRNLTTQRFIADDAVIDVCVNPRTEHHTIRIEANGPFYEFFTPESITDAESDVPGSVTSMSLGTRKAKAVSSGALVGKWRFPADGHERSTLCRTAFAHNRQRNPQYIHWIGDAKKGWTSSTLTGLGSSHQFLLDLGYSQQHVTLQDDGGLDLPPVFYAPGKKPVSRIPDVFDLSDGDTEGIVYSRACVREVEHETHGKRLFFILVDSLNRFYVYPVAVTEDDTKVDEQQWTTSEYQHQDAPLPAWAAAASAGTAHNGLGVYENRSGAVEFKPLSTAPKLFNYYRYKWVFNSDGTKAAAVVSTQPQDMTTGFRTGIGAPITGMSHIKDYPSAFKVFDATPTGLTAEVDKYSFTGLVELDIDIALTGSDPDDYSFSLSVAQAFNSVDTGVYYMAADYAFDDKRLEALGVDEDDLIVASLALSSATNPDTPTSSGDKLVADDNRYGSYSDFEARVKIGKLGGDPIMTVLASRCFRSTGFAHMNVLAPDDSVLGTVDRATISSIYFDAALAITDVRNMNLRSLSFIMVPRKAGSGGYAEIRGVCAIAYGEVVFCDAWWDTSVFLDVPEAGGRYAVPLTAGFADLYKYTAFEVGLTVSGAAKLRHSGMIAVHPKGHVSFQLRPNYEYLPTSTVLRETFLDRIEKVKKDSDGVVESKKILTHRELFNKAFDATREYDWYTPSGDGNQADFCSVGIWSTTPVVYALPKDWNAT